MLRLAAVSVRYYAKKAPTGGPTMQTQRIKHAVETDPEKLAAYCCGSNIKQTGEDVKLGADEDYPEWLWTLRLGRPPEPHELDKNTEEYWERVHRLALLKRNRRLSKEMKPEIRLNSAKRQIAITESLVHRALAYKFYDPGHELDRTRKEHYRKYGPLGR